jgi:N-acetylglucosaminyldiphosphoundecaprenol N-acetyl-beta-D-mannosaminyltransferase
MSLNYQKILGIRVTISSKVKILEEIRKYLLSVRAKGVEPLILATPNPEQIVLAQRNKAFADFLNRADITLPDGVGIVWASRFLDKRQSLRRIPGVEFMEELVELAKKQRIRIGLIGGYAGLAVRAFECLRQKHPGVKGWVVEPGALSIGNFGDLSDLGEKIKKTKTQIVFVGLGAPKQEFLIDALSRQLSVVGRPVIFMSVGGSFDILAGRLQRAPVIMRLIGFEWFWRLVQQPWRWRRQMALFTFVWLVIKEKMLRRQK